MNWLKDILGGKHMSTLTPGMRAPYFSLPTIGGKDFSLTDALARGPALAVFFKVSCPVCQYAFPFLDRIFRNSPGKQVSFFGISQNDEKDTAAFIKKYQVSFPVLLDETKTFPASNAYGLTNVPTLFWIAQDGEIQLSSVGWSKKDVEEVTRKIAGTIGKPAAPLFRPDEKIPEFRPG